MSIQTHKQLDLANEQAAVALDMFLDRTSHVCALTLAGAAEEIFGKEIQRLGKPLPLKEELLLSNHLQSIWPGGKTEWKDFVARKNTARNDAKHLNELGELTVNLEMEACWMLVRAFSNRQVLELGELPREFEFNEWFYGNVVGV